LARQRNDIIVARTTIDLPAGITTLTDGAYHGLPGVTPPPTHGPHQLATHQRLRARIKHTIARMKDWQTLRQCRRHANDLATQAVAYLHNLQLEI
jgi:hypothetical protein